MIAPICALVAGTAGMSAKAAAAVARDEQLSAAPQRRENHFARAIDGGPDFRERPGIAGMMFRSLAAKGVNILAISTSISTRSWTFSVS